MKYLDYKKRILAADKLLREKTTTKQKFKSIRTLIKGINPQIDKQLSLVSKALKKLNQLEKRKFIDLTLETLPEKSKKDKKRKKALLLFLKRWRQLKGEVKKINKEFEKHQQSQQSNLIDKVSATSKIIAKAKGPFGLITIAAVVIVASTLFLTGRKETAVVIEPTPSLEVEATPTPEVVTKQTIKAIIFEDKYLPLSELFEEVGPNCQEPHYHPNNYISATAIDGTVIHDPHPESCGFGKVEEIELVEIPE